MPSLLSYPSPMHTRSPLSTIRQQSFSKRHCSQIMSQSRQKESRTTHLLNDTKSAYQSDCQKSFAYPLVGLDKHKQNCAPMYDYCFSTGLKELRRQRYFLSINPNRTLLFIFFWHIVGSLYFQAVIVHLLASAFKFLSTMFHPVTEGNALYLEFTCQERDSLKKTSSIIFLQHMRHYT